MKRRICVGKKDIRAERLLHTERMAAPDSPSTSSCSRRALFGLAECWLKFRRSRHHLLSLYLQSWGMDPLESGLSLQASASIDAPMSMCSRSASATYPVSMLDLVSKKSEQPKADGCIIPRAGGSEAQLVLGPCVTR